MVNFSFAANRKMVFGTGSSRALLPLLSPVKGTILFLTGRSVTETAPWEVLRKEMIREGIRPEFITISGEPSPESVDSVVQEWKSAGVAHVVALGGGSVLDTGKAVSAMLCEEGSVLEYLEGVGTAAPGGKKVPFTALPTTAGTGSECTKNAVISRPGSGGFKKSLRHDNYIPDTAIIDPVWTASLPRRLSASCGMDAFSQLLESYLSDQASPVTDSLARTGLENFFRSFSSVLEGRAGDSDREAVSLGASLSGLTLANAGLGTVHGLAGVLGGLFEIPHGAACGILMPPVMRLTLSNLLEKEPSHPAVAKAADLGRFLKGEKNLDLEDGILALIGQLDLWADTSALPGLEEYGIGTKDLPAIAARSGNKNNPYAFSEKERRELLESCL